MKTYPKDHVVIKNTLIYNFKTSHVSKKRNQNKNAQNMSTM